jgi:hypothetical protein
MEFAMDKTVARLNIEHFRRKLADEVREMRDTYSATCGGRSKIALGDGAVERSPA